MIDTTHDDLLATPRHHVASGPSLLFWLVALALLMAIWMGDRSQLLDQQNYVNYFKLTDAQWFTGLWETAPTLFDFLARISTEEAGWRCWVIFLNQTGLDPEAAVRVTVVLLNLLIVLALSRTNSPGVGLALWMLVPVGLATIGLFQLRQGFAFAIVMFFATCLRRPVYGAVLASAIHTTFVIPCLFIVLARMLRHRGRLRSICVMVLTGFAVAACGAVLFGAFGGRRRDQYADLDGALNATFLVSISIYLAVPLILCMMSGNNTRAHRRLGAAMTYELAFMHAGVCIYLIASFFIYPFGTTRVGYYGPALLAFTVPQLKVNQRGVAPIVMLCVFSMIAYEVVKNCMLGTYDYFF